MKKLIALILLCLTAQAFALELAGVKLDDKAQVGNAMLQLNGADIRTKLLFKVYVGALYLGVKRHVDAAALADKGDKRVALHMLRELSSAEWLAAFNKGLAANNTSAVLDASIKEFSSIFHTVNQVVKGDVITLDYIQGEGTRISVNGVEKGRVAGAEFNRALLKIWLGEQPVDGDLKKGMLGG